MLLILSAWNHKNNFLISLNLTMGFINLLKLLIKFEVFTLCILIGIQFKKWIIYFLLFLNFFEVSLITTLVLSGVTLWKFLKFFKVIFCFSCINSSSNQNFVKTDDIQKFFQLKILLFSDTHLDWFLIFFEFNCRNIYRY